jgi:preprotein translocase subunit YajC
MKEISLDIGNQYLGSTGHFLYTPTGMGKLVSILVSNSITIAGVVLIFLLIYGGRQMQSNWENPEAVKEGQKIITYSLLGFIIVVAAYFLIKIIESSTGVAILN